MSAPSSPYSECSTLEPPEFKVDPKVLKMLVAILTCRHGFVGMESCSSLTGTPATGRPTNTGRKYTLHDLRLIVRHMYSAIHVAFALQMTLMLKSPYFGVTEGFLEVSTLPNARPALAGICVMNVEKFFGRVCIPAVYYPRREMNYPARFHRMIKTPGDSVDVGSVPIAVDCDIWEH
ncbi:hypothetical protein C8R48DRAFT_781283 [Suillus tomentosus]|nr:hypothetical protein C8R48DRAFT_781283 [Suillus tomentosus]